MSHPQQRQFCEKVKAQFPDRFRNKRVLDVGSLDINGSNKYLFENCEYTGIDLGPGKNVDVVCPAHEFLGSFDTIISTEAFEHDPYFEKTLRRIVLNLLVPGGLFLFTCATKGRPEHGTHRRTPYNAPFTNDFYKNISEDDVRSVLDLDVLFEKYEFGFCWRIRDLYFWGIKK
jgi:SAM-dependent methyltransferase